MPLISGIYKNVSKPFYLFTTLQHGFVAIEHFNEVKFFVFKIIQRHVLLVKENGLNVELCKQA